MDCIRAISKLTGEVDDFYLLETAEAKTSHIQWIFKGIQYFFLECYEVNNFITVTEDDFKTMELNPMGILVDKEVK